MPIYEYYCADCHTKFETRRPMSQADAEIACKQCAGQHTSRVLSLFAVGGGVSANRAGSPAPAAAGGCCGGACGCHHHHH